MTMTQCLSVCLGVCVYFYTAVHLTLVTLYDQWRRVWPCGKWHVSL